MTAFGEDYDWESDQLYHAIRAGLPDSKDEGAIAKNVHRRVRAQVLAPLLVRIQGLERALVDAEKAEPAREVSERPTPAARGD